MTHRKAKQNKKTESRTDKVLIKTLGTLLAVTVITIVSGYASTFTRIEDLNKLERKTTEKSNALKTRITVLETNYINILAHLKSIKESIKIK